MAASPPSPSVPTRCSPGPAMRVPGILASRVHFAVDMRGSVCSPVHQLFLPRSRCPENAKEKEVRALSAQQGGGGGSGEQGPRAVEPHREVDGRLRAAWLPSPTSANLPGLRCVGSTCVSASLCDPFPVPTQLAPLLSRRASHSPAAPSPRGPCSRTDGSRCRRRL